MNVHVAILVIRFKAFLVLLVSMEVFKAISVYLVLLLVKELIDSLIMLRSGHREELILLLVHSPNRIESSWEDYSVSFCRCYH